MNYWILPANPKKYNHLEAFEKFGYIDWVQTNNFTIGDIVYIYCARPISKIICKSIVTKVNLTGEEKTNDHEFWTDNDAERKSLSRNRFCRLEQVLLNNDSNVTINFLKSLQISSFQGAQRIKLDIAKKINEILKSDCDLFDCNETFPEGARIQIFANRFERNPEARKRCLEFYKSYRCQVCGFDFEKEYGEVGKNFIHIHHITPISEIRDEYHINPTKDLIPVCPNCHAMLHRNINGDTLTIEQLKSYKQKNR